MSTRGLVGFVVDGALKCTYNHSDSYPTWEGMRLAEFIQAVEAEDGWDQARDQARSLRLIDTEGGIMPTDDEKLHLIRWANFSVNERSDDDWYCLLRGTQGEPREMLEAGIIEDSVNFGLYSTWCEWGYLLDLDRMVLEVYRGRLHEMHESGRWVDGSIEWKDVTEEDLDDQGRMRGEVTGSDEHDVPIHLIAEIAFDDICSGDAEQLMKDLQEQGREMTNLQWQSYKDRTGR